MAFWCKTEKGKSRKYIGMYHIIQKRKIYYTISGVFILAGVLAIIFFGLRFGIDFTGGSSMEITASSTTDASKLQSILSAQGLLEPEIRVLDSGSFRITVHELTQDEHASLLSALQTGDAEIKEISYSSTGPTIGKELKSKSLLATILVLLFIVIYISWTFRKASWGPVKPWVWGVAALIALSHDLVGVVGVFAILGEFTHVRIDTLFITALLTVLGFSVHDTIVVFDRIRERIKIHGGKESFEDTVNTSVVETMVRSLATSFTAVLVLVALLLFGGESVRYFVLALIVGIVSGTYSSIYIASPLLVSWYQHKIK
jgi:preprotein translocase subunit SecF